MSDLGQAKASIELDVSGVSQGVAEASRSLGSLEGAFSNVGKAVSGIGGTITKPFKAAAGAIGDIGKAAAGFAIGGALTELPGMMLDFAKAAAADEQATARLQTTLHNLGGDFDALSGQMDDAISSGQKLAFSDDDVRDSFQSIATATGDAQEAFKRQKVAMDLARGAGIPLAAASKMVGKVTEENVDAFKRLGINIAEGASEAEALAAVQAKFAGQSEAYASSTAGQFESAQLALGEIQESIGTALLPVLATIGKVLAANMPAIQAFVGALGGGLGKMVSLLMDKLQPALDAVGKAISALTSGDVGGAFTAIVDGMGEMIGNVLTGLVDAAPQIASALGSWVSTFAGAIAKFAPALLSGLADLMQQFVAWFTENQSTIAQQLGEWGVAFVQWIGPMIGPMLLELGKISVAILQFIGQVALTLGEAAIKYWIPALLKWIAGLLAQLPGQLATIGSALLAWIGQQATALATELVTKWVPAFVNWVGDAVKALPGELVKIGTAIVTWIGDTTGAIVERAKQLGGDLLRGIADGVRAAARSLADAAVKAVQDALDAARRAIPGQGGGSAPGGGGGGPSGRAAPAMAPYVYALPSSGAMLRAGGAATMAPIWTAGGGGARAAAAPAGPIAVRPMELTVHLTADGNVNASLVQGVREAFDDFGAELTSALGQSIRERMR